MYPTSGTYTVTQYVYATIDGQSVRMELSKIVVISIPIPVPSISVIHVSGFTFRFDASGSAETTGLLWDLGNGVLRTETEFTHAFPFSGCFEISLTASNQYRFTKITHNVTVSDESPITAVDYKAGYRYTVPVASGTGVPSLIGAAWLSVIAYGDGYVIVSGVPDLVSYVDKNHNVRLSVNGKVYEWTVKVIPPANWPVAGFDFGTDGPNLTVVSTAKNWDRMTFSFYDGDSESDSGCNRI